MPVALKLMLKKTEPLYRGQDHYWRVMRALDAGDGREFTVSQIRSVTDDTGTAPIRAFVQRLVQSGVAEVASSQASLLGRDERVYRLLKRPEETPIVSRDGQIVRPTTGQQQMWNVMRGPTGRRGFTPQDLVTFGSTDDVAVTLATAKTYIQNLARAGYLLQVAEGGPARFAVWRLKPSRNTGPRPPMILRAKLVFDQNRHAVMGETIAEEDRP